LKTLDTVPRDTPAARPTSSSVGIFHLSFLPLTRILGALQEFS
jgi:hypothetical protein